MKQFMNCMDRVVRDSCGKEAAAWQWNASLAIMLGNEFDKYCLNNNSKLQQPFLLLLGTSVSLSGTLGDAGADTEGLGARSMGSIVVKV